MAFDFYLRYRFPHHPKNKWEAYKIVEEIKSSGQLDHYFQSQWPRLEESPYQSGNWFIDTINAAINQLFGR